MAAAAAPDDSKISNILVETLAKVSGFFEFYFLYFVLFPLLLANSLHIRTLCGRNFSKPQIDVALSTQHSFYPLFDFADFGVFIGMESQSEA